MKVSEETFKGVKYCISMDSDSESPLEHDELFYVVSNSYTRSMNGSKTDPFELAGYELDYEDRDEDIEKIETFMRNNSRYLVLPLYKFEHSGVAYSTVPFSCRWDSGQMGWLLIDRDEMGWSRWSAKRKAQAIKLAESALVTYSSWCNGDVYRFDITVTDEGYGGYFSQEDAIAGAEEYINEYEVKPLAA
jgi:hypothetical protein